MAKTSEGNKILKEILETQKQILQALEELKNQPKVEYHFYSHSEYTPFVQPNIPNTTTYYQYPTMCGTNWNWNSNTLDKSLVV